MINVLVNLVIYLIVVGLIFMLLNYLVDNLPLADPFRRIAKIVLMVVGVLILIFLLLGLIGESPGVPKLRIGSALGVVASHYLAMPNVLAKAVALAGLQLAPAFGKVLVVEAISLDRAEAVLADGSVWPIVGWLDDEGDHCGREDAAVAIAGSDWTGWTAIVLDDFAFGAKLH